jgi:hypothetical protein
MGRLLHMLITLPLIVSPLSLLVGESAHGATLSQADALSLLAKSKAADTKCNILGPGEADELASYLARAEIAMTQRSSVEDTQGTIAVGKTLGAAASCDPATAEEVNGTLDAARRAMAAVEEAERRDSQSIFRSKPDKTKSKGDVSSRMAVTVERYRQQAFAYYLERRCRHLSARQARSFWSSIVRQHEAALRRDGGRKVAAALRRAKASAEDTPCGSESRHIVRAGYSESSAF